MNVKKILLLGVVVVIILWIFMSGGGSKFSTEFKGEVPAKIEAGAADIKDVTLFCDFSGSMRGYIDFSGLNDAQSSQNNLVSNLSNLVNKIERGYDATCVAKCGNKTYTRKDLIDGLNNKSIFNAGQTYLWDLIEKSVQAASDTSISIVVSDMLLSYGKSKLLSERDADYNLHQLNGLTGKVGDVLTDAKKAGMQVLILQYLSDFNGKYYYNYTENIRGDRAYLGKVMHKRPYYVMLIGTKNNLESIITRDLYPDAENIYASFVEANPALVSADFTITTAAKDWQLPVDIKEGKPGCFEKTFDGADPADFNISCNSFFIPRYYYKDNASFVARDEKDGSVVPGSINFDPATTTLSFVFRSLPSEKLKTVKGGSPFNMTIYCSNNWVSNAQVNDNNDVDCELADLEGRTWGFQSLIDAINDVYYGKTAVTESKVATLSFLHY